MSPSRNAFGRLYRGETHFEFAGRWRRWFIISGAVILIGLVSLAVQGLNFSIQFKGGTVWEVPSAASVPQDRAAIDRVSPLMTQATVQVLTNRQTGQRTIEVQAAAQTSTNAGLIRSVADTLAALGHTSSNNVAISAVGPSWGANITNKAVKAVIIFLVVVTAYIWKRFEPKMAAAALVALLHDIAVTAGIYSLSGLPVSPDTVIAFLTILGYSLYDTIVVFDKVQENTKALSSTNRSTSSETVNLSMNQVLARSLNTSFVAIIPILSILVVGGAILGAGSLNSFGLALFVGLTTGAYSSIFIASPLLALLKEREPRYAEIRRRLAGEPRGRGPKGRASRAGAVMVGPVGIDHGTLGAGDDVEPDRPGDVPAPVGADRNGTDRTGTERSSAEVGSAVPPTGGGGPRPARSTASGRAVRPPPRPRKKTRRR